MKICFTKSQLTDFYNQAQGTSKLPAQEFADSIRRGLLELKGTEESVRGASKWQGEKVTIPLGERIIATGEQKPTIKLKRDVTVTTLQGEKVTIPEDEVLKAYESGGKALLTDGREYIVSKSQYENIKNNSLKGATPVPKGMEILATEARKYKSAEDFVKAQGQPLLHFTDEANLGSIEKGGLRVTKASEGKITDGISVATKRTEANEIFGEATAKVFLDPKAKTITLKEVLDKMGYAKETDIGIIKNVETEAPAWARENGYDVLDMRDARGAIYRGMDEIRVLNPDVVKTKSQLTDFYNSLKSEAKPFAPELSGTEESVRGSGNQPEIKKIVAERERLGKIMSSPERTTAEYLDAKKKYNELNAQLEKVQATTKFSQYQLPGGKNYREIIVKAPENVNGYQIQAKTGELYSSDTFSTKAQAQNYMKDEGLNDKFSIVANTDKSFKSSHWDEPNVISHLRLNERTYKGKKVTFMEEMQSDWAMEGRSKGFSDSITKDTAKNQGFTVYKAKNNQGTESYFIDNPKDEYYYRKGFGAQGYDTEGEAWNRILTGLKDGSIPNNPLLKNWQELSIKRALKEAVDNNSEYLAWISGEQTSARYNLATHLDNVKWHQDFTNNIKKINLSPKDKAPISLNIKRDGTIIKGSEFGLGGENVPSNWAGKKLDEVIGKGLADKIMEQETGQLSGEGLNFGGEWAKNLYDKQVKNIVEDITGHKVEVIDMGLAVKSDTGLRGDRTWREIERVTSSGHQVTGLELKPKDLSIGKHISDGGENSGYIITDIIGEKGKFKAVPKKIWEEKAHTGRVAFESHKETFDISTKLSSGQQAIHLTPEIKALVRGEPLKLK